MNTFKNQIKQAKDAIDIQASLPYCLCLLRVLKIAIWYRDINSTRIECAVRYGRRALHLHLEFVFFLGQVF